MLENREKIVGVAPSYRFPAVTIHRVKEVFVDHGTAAPAASSDSPSQDLLWAAPPVREPLAWQFPIAEMRRKRELEGL